MDKTYDVLKDIFKILPERIVHSISKLPSEIKENIQEIRLRTNRPVALTCESVTYYLTDKSFTADLFNNLNYIKVSKIEITETFTKACTYSVYNRQQEISNGFITINGGHRMGISGTGVYSKGDLVNVKDITSLNIRIAREFIGCSRNLLEQLNNNFGSILICGKPCSGKTTLIRDLARELSLNYGKKVCVIDSRNEISSTYRGELTKDLGNCDVYSMYKKTDAIEHSVRNMAPDYVVCDEIVTEEEVKAISYGLNSGVNFIATIHSSSPFELKNKVIFKALQELNGFSSVVMLKNIGTPCTVDSIISMKEIGK